LPDVFDAEGILTDQQWFEVLNSTLNRQLAPGNPRFTKAVNARIRINDYK
jgi:hypothetical protein